MALCGLDAAVFNVEQRCLRFCLAQQVGHVWLAGKVEQLMGLALSAASQLHKGPRRALGPLRVKVDQHFVHDHGQGRGMQGVVLDVGEAQGQVGLFTRAPAEVFGLQGLTLRGQDGKAGIFKRGIDAAPALARNARKYA